MNAAILRDLGNGLILRRSSPADAEALSAFNANIHCRTPQEPDARVGAWVHDLLTLPHPTFNPEDFTIVEDTRTGQIVSSLNLISQTWTYAGIPFGVGRPELVGTLPEYRTRGLIRAQFEVIHRWSAERGQVLQAITGIPYFYRQFGYEMTLTLGGGRIGYRVDVPKLKEGETEPFQVRPATPEDIPFMAQVYDDSLKRSLVACPRDEALWRHELSGRSTQNVTRSELRLITTASGEPVGILGHNTMLHGQEMGVGLYELKPGISWLSVTPSILRYLMVTGDAYAARDQKGECLTYGFWLTLEHPVFDALPNLFPRVAAPYTWYIRIADLPGFIGLIKPVLEARLAASSLAAQTFELKLSFYRRGIRLVFEQSRLTTLEAWQPTPKDWGNARFPDLTFLHLLLGYRSVEELEYAFADCRATTDEVRALLHVLFPKQPSNVYGIT